MSLSEVPLETEVSLRTAARQENMGGGQGYFKCMHRELSDKEMQMFQCFIGFKMIITKLSPSPSLAPAGLSEHYSQLIISFHTITSTSIIAQRY